MEPDLQHGIVVYHARPERFAGASAQQRLLALLDEGERARRERFRFERDRQAYLVAHALARSVVGRHVDCDPGSLRFEVGEHGKPELVRSEAEPRVRFNLSHTEGLVACAVSLEHDLGVDVEHAQREVDVDGVARSVFSSVERGDLDRFDDAARRARFFEYWTLKEAYVKAVGRGIGMPLRAITFRLGAVPSVEFGPEVDDRGHEWRFWLFRPTAEHVLSVARRCADRVTIGLQEWPGL
ncbi:MAG: 4'-phosphopantetheinyl transferase superfamily protein [Myxococcales bacterium]